MAKKEQPKPFYPLYHEFVESARAFAQAAAMLADATKIAINQGMVDDRVKDILLERVKAFDAARSSDT